MNNGHRIMFLRNEHSHPIGCIAIKVEGGEQFAYYRLSVLNPADQFNREQARSLAIGRLTERGIPVRLPKNPNMHDISRAVMEDIIKAPTSPARAIKAAKLWLKSTDKKILVSN